ncbi:MAG: MCE family protein, partial [Bacteroidaceae bacterium]|nr:MCE family protein [Bacteroidaceae bacterium]
MKTEVKIGLVGVIALVALFLGINFLKGVNLFSTSEKYYITFANAKGLTKSSAVYADGYKVGIV